MIEVIEFRRDGNICFNYDYNLIRRINVENVIQKYKYNI
jgi:hypothetical protein